MKYKKTKMKNGLRLITVPIKETETATVVILVGTGSRYEKEKEAGASHFVEHMFFKGTEKRPGAMAIAEELDSIGGEYNAFTSKDKTGYYVKVDHKHLDVALDVVSDIYLNSKIEEQELEKEKGTILQEISMDEDTPIRDVRLIFEELLYANNPLGRDIAGSKKTVKAFTRNNLITYMKRFYVANDTIVCVAGKFSEKKLRNQVREHFFEMKKGKKIKPKKIIENQKLPKSKIKYKKTDQTHLVVGNRAFHENHKDRFALSLLSIILGGNMSSRIFSEVREKRGLAYFVRTDTTAYEDCGYIATQAGIDHKNLELTVKTIIAEYNKIATEKISDKELKKAKDYLKGRSVMELESSDEVAMFFVGQEAKKGEIMTIQEIFSEINKVTPNDILRVAKNIFKKEKLNLAVIGPHKNKKKIQKALEL